MTRKMTESVDSGSLLSRLIEVKDSSSVCRAGSTKFSMRLGNELRIGVDAIDEKSYWMDCRRWPTASPSVDLAALIVGAALMMRVEPPSDFWLSGLAHIFFLMAAVAGLILAARIVFTDEKPKKKHDEE